MSTLTSTLQWYLRQFGLTAYRRQLVFYHRPATQEVGDPALPDGFEFRFVAAGDLESLHYPGGWLRLPEARAWLERGDRDMLATIRDGRICSFLWVERGIALIDYTDLQAPLPPGHVYISKVFVSPQWRRYGLASAMYRFFSHREPHLTAHSACVTENLPMHLLFSKLDWRVRLLLKTVRLACLCWHHVEFVTGDRARSFLTTPGTSEWLFSVPATRTDD